MRRDHFPLLVCGLCRLSGMLWWQEGRPRSRQFVTSCFCVLCQTQPSLPLQGDVDKIRMLLNSERVLQLLSELLCHGLATVGFDQALCVPVHVRQVVFDLLMVLLWGREWRWLARLCVVSEHRRDALDQFRVSFASLRFLDAVDPLLTMLIISRVGRTIRHADCLVVLCECVCVCDVFDATSCTAF